ncbi:MAG: transcriptional regulator [Firmicutes bacterium]|nr:transcriptional regulator [Bacillota bacterium]
MLPYFNLPFDHPESLHGGDYVVATYLVHGLSEAEALKRVGGFAVGQSIGTWTPLPGITREMVEGHQARIVGCHFIPSAEEKGLVFLQVAFPLPNFGKVFAMMLTALVGNDASTALRARLLDIQLVGAACDLFVGPHHGIEGIRRLVGVEGRPLVLNMLKPCTGYPPEVGAELFYQVGLGGVDLIKDDELLADSGFNGVVARVKAYLAAAKRLREETGRSPLYFVNITDRPERMRENAQAVIEAGGKAVMVNFVLTGLDALAELAEDFGEELVILAHFAGAGIIGQTIDHGVALPLLLGKFPRMAGADAVVSIYPAGLGKVRGYLDHLRIVQAHRLPLGKMKPVFTVVGGGVTPLNVAEIYRELGTDIIIAAGGAVQGHPMGATAGAKAMMQAVEAAVSGVELEVAAAEYPELRRALTAWGHSS